LYCASLPNPKGKQLEQVFASSSSSDFDQLKKTLQSGDPFLIHAAISALTHANYRQQVLEATHDNNPDVRLGALIALQQSGYEKAKPVLRQLLVDSDERIRQRALIWIGKEGMTALQKDIDRALTAGPVSSALFETYLETVSHLMPDFIKAYRSRSEPYAKAIKRNLPPHFLETFISDNSRPASLRALAIRHLSSPKEQLDLLTRLLMKEKEPVLRQEIVRSLADIPGENVANQLLKVVLKPGNPISLRAEALLALTRQPVDVSVRVIPLLEDQQPDIQIEAARYLRTKISSNGVKLALQQKYASLHAEDENPLREQLAMALSSLENGNTLSRHPSTLEEWQAALTRGGDPARGHRVFYAMQSMCSMCHAVGGRGGDLGPDLSNAGESKTRSQLVHSILSPSEEISPEYQGWFIKLKNGEVHQGRQIDIGGSTIELYTPAAGFVTFHKKDIEDYGKIDKSLMPDGLEKQLTLNDLRDLISFLEAKSNIDATSISLQPSR
jgi:putative heme-binding domain-containing protein